MSGLGVSALTTSAISGVKLLRTRPAYIEAANNPPTPPHTLIQVDACIKEVHSMDAKPSEFPIESGQDITDNIVIKPFALDMEGIISDDPVKPLTAAVTSALSTFLPPAGIIAGGAAVAAFNALSGSSTPSVANFNQFLKILTGKTPVNVYTTLYFYKSMWLTSIHVDRSAELGSVLSFRAHFVQIILVQPQTVNVAQYSNSAVSSAQANLGKTGSNLSNIVSAGFTNGNLTSTSQVNSLFP